MLSRLDPYPVHHARHICPCELWRGQLTCFEHWWGRPACSGHWLGQRCWRFDLYILQVSPSTVELDWMAWCRESSVSLIHMSWSQQDASLLYYQMPFCFSDGYLWWLEERIMFSTLLLSVSLLIPFELRGVAISTYDTCARPPKHALIVVIIWVTKIQHFKCSLMPDFKYKNRALPLLFHFHCFYL